MRHTYSSLTLQIYAVLPFCPWYFYKKLEARKKIRLAMRLYFTSWDKNPRPSVNYCSTVQRLLGGSSVHFRSFPETFGETANMPHISKEVGKTFFLLWFSWLQYKIPRFSEAGITLWRDLFKVRNPPVSSLVIIFVIITSGVSQGTRNHSVSKWRNLTGISHCFLIRCPYFNVTSLSQWWPFFFVSQSRVTKRPWYLVSRISFTLERFLSFFCLWRRWPFSRV